jgi:uracil-DNA glycosylase
MDVKIEKSWKNILAVEAEKPYFKQLMDFVTKEYKEQSVFPIEANLFRAFNVCPFDKVKVVILGQDPYHTKGMADGLCFSVPSTVSKLPPSLKNILKELEVDLGVQQQSNGDLTSWAEQGVLLINTVLTVREGLADSHADKGWGQFTDAVISALNTRKTGVVYVLWGSKAQSKEKELNHTENLILMAPHPSPLSSYRGFFGCKHFSKTNEYLRSKSVEEIKW